MFGTILCLVILGIVFTLFGKMSLNDPDFKDIAVTKSDKIWFGIYLAVFVLIIIKLPICQYGTSNVIDLSIYR